MTDLQTRKKSMKAKEMYTWLVATDHLSDTVRDNILKSAMRMLAQNHKLFTEALDETAKGHIPSHISIGKASSEDFPLSFIIWLKSKGIDVDSLESATRTIQRPKNHSGGGYLSICSYPIPLFSIRNKTLYSERNSSPNAHRS
jgi:hypothetical protein